MGIQRADDLCNVALTPTKGDGIASTLIQCSINLMCPLGTDQLMYFAAAVEQTKRSRI